MTHTKTVHSSALRAAFGMSCTVFNHLQRCPCFLHLLQRILVTGLSTIWAEGVSTSFTTALTTTYPITIIEILAVRGGGSETQHCSGLPLSEIQGNSYSATWTMGIPYLLSHLQPYGVETPLAGAQIVLDGPSLAYHIWHLCSKRQDVQASHHLISETTLTWLESLQNHGAQM